MARNALDDWKRLLGSTDDLESPLDGSGIAALDGPDAADPLADDAPTPSGPASIPATGGARPISPPAHPLEMPLPHARRAIGNPDELADAQAKDSEEKRKAAFESGLDIAAFRKPFQPRDVGTPNADALMSRIGLQRQGAQDERQGRQDEMAAFVNDAKVKAYLAKANAPAKTAIDRLSEKKKMDDAEAQGVHRVILASYGPQLEKLGFDADSVAHLSKDAAHKLLDELQKSRAIQHVDTRSHNSLNETSRGHDIAEQGLGVRKTQMETELGKNRVAGWDGEKPLQPSQSKDFADQLAGQQTIHALTGEAKHILAQNQGVDLNPNSPVMTSLRQKMAALYPAVVKSGGYGTLTQGHQHLLDLAIGGDPGEFSNYLRNTVNPARLPQMLDDIAHEADMAVRSQAGALGLRRAAPHGNASSATPSHASQPGATKARRTDPATGETRVWNGSAWVKE